MRRLVYSSMPQLTWGSTRLHRRRSSSKELGRVGAADRNAARVRKVDADYSLFKYQWMFSGVSSWERTYRLTLPGFLKASRGHGDLTLQRIDRFTEM